MRADRLLGILMNVQLRGRVTAGQLAERLEVSVRTIYRDIDALSRAGVPVVTERGRHGGLSLLKGYRTELTGLSESEAHALPFVGLDAAAAALGLEASAEAARLKVFAALTPKGRDRAGRIRECFYLDPVDWYRRADVPTHLRAVAAATWAMQAIKIDYESWAARKTRTVDPLGLVLKAGRWYLIARLAERKTASIFRMESIRAVETLARRFDPPKRFDLARIWREEVRRFEASLRGARATIRFAANAMSRIDRLDANAAENVRAAEPDSQGWREASIWIESVSHASSVLLGFGADVEVLTPDELRREIRKRAIRVCALYG